MLGRSKLLTNWRASLQLQPLDDVGARDRVGRRRERDARHRGVALVQHRERAVLRPEVVAPLAHAMRLVDREQAELAALVQRIELGQEARRGHALRRGVQQRDFAAQHALFHGVGLLARQRGVEEFRFDAGLVQRADLVVHQGDQRRHHDGDAVAGALARDGRDLVAQRLAAAGGHQHQGVAAGDDVVDDGRLRTAELLVAEDVVEDGAGGAGRWQQDGPYCPGKNHAAAPLPTMAAS